MEEPVQTPLQEIKPQRPRLLTIICILTFIGSGMIFFSSVCTFFFYDSFKASAPEIAKSFNLPGIEQVFEVSSLFFVVTAFIYAGAFAGAVFMWQLRKIGFHIYTISQILLVIAPMYFFKLPGPGVMDILLAGVFILLYSMNLKVMS
jgi:hypothetical protein